MTTESKRTAKPQLPPMLADISKQTEDAFEFDPSRLFFEFVRIAGGDPRRRESFMVYLGRAGQRFPGRAYGYEAAQTNDDPDYILMVAAWELVQELDGTRGHRPVAVRTLHELRETLEKFVHEGLFSVETLARAQSLAEIQERGGSLRAQDEIHADAESSGTVEISFRPHVEASLRDVLRDIQALRNTVVVAASTLERNSFLSQPRKKKGRGAPNDWHLANSARFLHEHGFTWARIADLLQDVGTRKNARERMRQRVQRHFGPRTARAE